MNKLQYNQPRAQAGPQKLRPWLKLALYSKLENNHPYSFEIEADDNEPTQHFLELSNLVKKSCGMVRC